MQKRSKSLSLVLMGSLTLGLSGCASDENITEEFKAYNSVDECVQDGTFAEAECREMAAAAVKQNPKFANKAECEKEFGEGNCQTDDIAATGDQQNATSSAYNSYSGGGSWMPLMAGYMMGRFMGGGGPMQGSQPLYNQQQPQQSGSSTTNRTTVFRTRTGETVKTDGNRVTNPSSTVRQGIASTAKPAAVRSGGASSRGGFSGKSVGGGGS